MRIGDGEPGELRSDPEQPGAIDHQGIGHVLGQARRVAFVLPQCRRGAGLRIEATQAGAGDRQPQGAIRSFGDRLHAHGIGCVRLRPHALQAVAIAQQVQAAVAARPGASGAVDAQRQHRPGRSHAQRATVRADPEQAGAVRVPDIAVAVARQCLETAFDILRGKREDAAHAAAARIEPIEPGAGADPDRVGRGQQRFHPRMVRPFRRIAMNAAAAEIEAGDVFGAGPDPQPLVGIDRERGDEIVLQARRVVRDFVEGHEALAVVAAESALGADPDEAVGILGQCGHRALGEAEFAARAHEIDVAHRGARGPGRRQRHACGACGQEQDPGCGRGLRGHAPV